MNEAELLFTEVLNCDRMFLYLNRELPLDRGKGRLVSSILKRRLTGEPIHYILTKSEFMGLEFKLTPSVLVPRMETEILVEATIRLVRDLRPPSLSTSIIDIGTGSGCIAVSLAKFLPQAIIFACDISPEALAVARENSRTNKVDVVFFSERFIRRTLF